MSLHSTVPPGSRKGVVALLGLLLGGCGPLPFGTNNTVGEILGTQTTTGNLIRLSDATPVAFGESGQVVLVGNIEGVRDIDAYDLGPCVTGDHYSIRAEQSGGLDSVAALFDAESNLMMLNDDSFLFQSPSSPAMEYTVRWSSEHLFLVVAASPKRNTDGGYSISVTRTQAGSPAAAPAGVILDWNGATGVSVGGSVPVDVPPFDGGLIDPSYADDTAALIDLTVQFIREDFADLNVAFFLDGQPGIPAGPKSVVYFGTYSPVLLGLADTVDYYNAVPDQEAIVYTDAFALFMPLAPSVAEMARSLANVASHEVGHLLGLNHTQDPRSVMDITATAYELLQDESFRRAPMHPAVLATGFQNAVSLLLATVGGTADPNAARGVQDWYEKLDDPREAARAVMGSVVIRKDLFCAHQCGGLGASSLP